MFKNYMEEIVEEVLPTILDKYKDICKCEICRNDIKAIALNKLKPLYFSTEEGEVYQKMRELDTQFKTDVVNELMQAVEIVSQNPRHDK